jgi:phosphohistidine phosphatase SixA
MNNSDLIYLCNPILLSKCLINNKISNKKIIISGTHNNRLECFFNKYLSKSKHFSNCAIIRCYTDINTEVNTSINKSRVCFSLIYTGDHNNSSYWLLEEFNNTVKKINFNINLPEDTEIFLIRHGKGIHNYGESLLDKLYYHSLSENNVIDPSLDRRGVDQAKAAGKFLKGYLQNYINSKMYFTASHLIRTQQTVGLIMEQLNITSSSIYIAPCTHEIIYIKPIISDVNNDCDCSLLQNIPVRANTPICNIDNMCPTLTKFCHTNCYNTNPIPLNWDYYKLFYSQTELKSNEKCCNNNMIHQIIRTILLEENHN